MPRVMILGKHSMVGLLLACGTIVSGCVTTSPEQLLTPTATNEPLGQAKNTGDYGNVYNNPTPATAQLTKAEVEQAKSELTREAAPSTAQAQQDNQATYRREVADLQKLARDQKKRRLQQIESRKF